jgi:hypothetical protein
MEIRSAALQALLEDEPSRCIVASFRYERAANGGHMRTKMEPLLIPRWPTAEITSFGPYAAEWRTIQPHWGKLRL